MRIILTGGGTLGSVTPLLALREEIRDRGIPAEFLWIGTAHGPEKELVQKEGIDFIVIPSGKLRRYADWRNVVAPFLVLAGFAAALVALIRARPAVIVSAGSFVSVPVVYAGAFLRIPIVLYQSDKRLGLANRLAAPLSARVLLAFAETAMSLAKDKRAVIGTPVRKKIELAASDPILREKGRVYFHVPEGMPAVLVLGGSSGSRALNELVVAALTELTKFAQVIHVVGKWKDALAPRSGVPNVPHPANGTRDGTEPSERYRACSFLHDELPLAYAAADIVISRAGMATIGELALLGKPAIFIPIPKSHQEENAAALAGRGAAVMLSQPISVDDFVKAVRELIAHPSRMESIGSAIRSIFPEDGRARFADVVLSIIKEAPRHS